MPFNRLIASYYKYVSPACHANDLNMLGIGIATRGAKGARAPTIILEGA